MTDPRVLSGELAALAAAVCWAVAVALFRAPIAAFGARAVNLAKNGLAAVLLGLTLVVIGQGETLLATDGRTLGLVAVSGLLGLTLGDTALFASVARIGPPRALLLQSFTPVFTALFALVFFGHGLNGRQMLGGGVILCGVVLVIRASGALAGSAGAGGRTGVDPAGWWLGALAAFSQAAGMVLAKEAMTAMPIVAASFVRMAVGAAGLVLMLALAGRLRAATGPLFAPAGLRRVIPASLIGTYFAFLLLMAGIAWAPAAIIAVLLATVPVWSLFLEAALNRRWITAGELVGTLVAVAGVAIVTLTGTTGP